MQQGLRAQNLADRGRERRPAGLLPDHGQLVEDVGQPVAGSVRAEVRVERGNEPRRQAVLRGANGDAGRKRRDRLVADVLVHELGGLPQCVDVDPGVEPEALQRR